MSTAAPTPSYTLLDLAYRQLTRELCGALPPAPTDEERDDREKAAIAQVAALHPDNTAEFELAGMFVLASQRAKHNATLADQPGLSAGEALRWNSQANLMMRQAQSAMRSLLRVQAARGKLEADPKAYDRAERIEHHMTVIMTEAIAGQRRISSNDPESQNQKTEILPRQTIKANALSPPDAPALSAPPPAAIRPPVSRSDPKSHTVETETQPRPPIPPPDSVTPPLHQRGPTTNRTSRPVSHHDPESRTPETETSPRHSATPTRPWRPLRPGYDFPLSDLATEDAL